MDRRGQEGTESEEQKALMEWAEYMRGQMPELELLFHVPNGGKRDIGVARKLKAEGVKAGVPDLWLPVARGEYHGLCIEMKRRTLGREEASQIWWREKLTEQKYMAITCRGWEEAAKAIKLYINGRHGSLLIYAMGLKAGRGKIAHGKEE